MGVDNDEQWVSETFAENVDNDMFECFGIVNFVVLITCVNITMHFA